ncbi:MAG: hypothetical protein RLZZ244_1619, partial [Verrucomicrobiota bacterium]
TYGAGMLVGSLTQGYVLKAYTLADQTVNWSPTWLIPAVGSGVILVAFLLFFRNPAPAVSQSRR